MKELEQHLDKLERELVALNELNERIAANDTEIGRIYEPVFLRLAADCLGATGNYPGDALLSALTRDTVSKLEAYTKLRTERDELERRRTALAVEIERDRSFLAIKLVEAASLTLSIPHLFPKIQGLT